MKFAEVDANGISEVKLYVTDKIKIESSLTSDVKHKGGATLLDNRN